MFLAIETATDVCSAALFRGEALWAVSETTEPRVHHRVLTAAVQQLFANMQVSPSDISAVGVSSGPGSYTGLRVGVAAAKGFCFVTGAPLIAVPTLTGLACQVAPLAARLDAYILPLLDARRQEVYAAGFAPGTPVGPQVFDVHNRLLDEDALFKWPDARPVLVVGDGAAKAQAFLTDERYIFLPDTPVGTATARAFGPYLLAQWRAGRFEDLTAFEPYYFKPVRITGPKK